MYKLRLSDNSFMMVSGSDKVKVYPRNPLMRPKTMTVNELVNHEQLYWMIDLYGKTKIKRGFIFEKSDENLPTGIRFKYSQHIRPGDLLIDENGKPTVVEELHTGEDDMYEIDIDGVTTIVNGGHILHLIDTETNEELDIPVNIYMHMDDEFKSHLVMQAIEEVNK